MMIFVAIASILVPAHHRLEHWVIAQLIRRRIRIKDKTNEPGAESDTEKNTLTEAEKNS
jgi:hypothetical protein